jgi:hypothetical protein
MRNLLILVLVFFVILSTVLFVKITKAVHSDRYHFSRLKPIAKAKYVVKTAFNIIDINARFYGREKHPKEEIISDRKVILLGASIGNYWHINEYFSFMGSLAVYRFDKSKELHEYLSQNGSKDRPDAIILKECAAFIHADKEQFTKEFKNYKKVYKDMIQIVRKNGAIPIAATICPLAYRGPHLENILRFNDWVKEYAMNDRLALMDIENAVRVSKNDRILKKEISQKDGLHLTREAYERYLNPLVVPVLLEAFNLS